MREPTIDKKVPRQKFLICILFTVRVRLRKLRPKNSWHKQLWLYAISCTCSFIKIVHYGQWTQVVWDSPVWCVGWRKGVRASFKNFAGEFFNSTTHLSRFVMNDSWILFVCVTSTITIVTMLFRITYMEGLLLRVLSCSVTVCFRCKN